MSEPKGIRFPFRFGAHGHAQRAEGVEKIKGNLRSIVMTALRERPHEPLQGSVGPQAVFRTPLLNFKRLLKRQIAFGEPRVVVDQIRVSNRGEGDAGGGTWAVTLSFRVKATGQTDQVQVTR